MTIISEGKRQILATSVAAADITGFTNAVRTEIDNPAERQILRATINGSGRFQTRTFPTPFPVGATIQIIGTPQDDNGSHYFVRTRSISRTAFQFIAVNFNGSIHTGAGVIAFIAERKN